MHGASTPSRTSTANTRGGAPSACASPSSQPTYAAALTLSLTTPVLASAAPEHSGVTAANASATAHIEPWLGPTHDPAHRAHRAHSYIQSGGPMIRVKTSSSRCAANTMHAGPVTLLCLRHNPAGDPRPTGCPESSTCTLARIVTESV